MSSPVDWALLSRLLDRLRAARYVEPCPDDVSYLRRQRAGWHANLGSLVAWTLSPEWTTPPTYTQPEPVSGEFEAR